MIFDGKGSAHVTFQATLINELADLKDVTANLVIGVPTFFFSGHSDPIGLQQVMAQLSPVLPTKQPDRLRPVKRSHKSNGRRRFRRSRQDG